MAVNLEVPNASFLVGLFRMHDPKEFDMFSDELKDACIRLNFTHCIKLWTLFVATKKQIISFRPDYRIAANYKESLSLKKTEVILNYTCYSIPTPKLLRLPFKGIGRNLVPGMYSGTLQLLVSNPKWIPSNAAKLFARPTGEDECDCCILVTDLQFVCESLPTEVTGINLFWSKVRNMVTTGTFDCS